jgi:TolB-like protein
MRIDYQSIPLFNKGGGRGDFNQCGIGKWGAVILLAFLLFLPSCSSSMGALKGGLSTLGEKYRVAVFPFQNLSGTPIPIKEIRQSFINSLEAKGFEILDDGILEKFMAKHRIRDTGGIDWATAQAFKKEVGVEGVLITSVDFYSEVAPPKMALTSRLVSTGDKVVILWMDGVGVAGDDSPGLLGLGLIEDPIKLLDNALDSLSASLVQFVLTKKEEVRAKHAEGKFKPKIVYRSPLMDEDPKYTVAVIPFFNESGRKNAAEIVVLHFVKELTKLQNFNVIELGVVKQRLLNARIIMLEGISLMDADLVLNSLEADLVLTGRVMDYQDYQGSWGKPKVDFSVTAIERKSRKVVWNSYSHNEGDDRVYFFDWGRVNTAHRMMAKMAQAIAEMMTRGK